MVLAGRGFGKTRAGAEWVRENVESGKAGRIALVADDAKDARDVMIEGESGLLSTSPPDWRPVYIPSQAKVVWERTGAQAILYSARDPEALRGPQHDLAWCDELSKWRYQRATWDQLQFGMRLGVKPRTMITNTPTPTEVILELFDRWEAGDRGVVITTGTTYENLENLAPAFRETIRRYEGTRLGQQELLAMILRDVVGALWSAAMVAQSRVRSAPELARVVVAVDPAATSGVDSAETGITVSGLDAATRQHGYLLADYSGRYSPGEWGERVLYAVDVHRADWVVAEGNNGGEMVGNTIVAAARKANRRPPRIYVVHTKEGKAVRAEPIAGLTEQGYVHLVGEHPQLEDQMTRWVPDGKSPSPDRLDSFVYGMTELLLKPAYTRKLVTGG